MTNKENRSEEEVEPAHKLGGIDDHLWAGRIKDGAAPGNKR